MFTTRTRERTIEILQEWLDSRNNPDHTPIECKISGCECGTTMAVETTLTLSGESISVPFCDSCGSDDVFADDVLITDNY